MNDRGSYFYRCYSHISAGGLISGKGPGQARPLGDDLLPEFINHLVLHTTKPTALVSVSSRMIDTLRRAFNKCYKDGEDASQIWIAFFYVPYADEYAYHHAEDLAEKFKMKNSRRLRYEYIFEWEIPKKYFIHELSVETLMKRGFNMSEFLVDDDFGGVVLPFISGSTKERSVASPGTSIPGLKIDFAKAIFKSSDNAHEVGIYLGLLARSFGARSPLHQIILQLQLDCFRINPVNPDDQLFRFSYDDDFPAIENGVDEVLIDWWLTDPDFCVEYEDHLAWAEQIREGVETEGELYKTEMQIEEAAIELGL
ncbi:hypothetical protein J4E90_007961 [Alternaria incomplexa]|uniref:uncharacterized protein n=1 Tax=Alternaria incomplexa TaxID=1187928 RepID=UPI00221EC445|nr:uncharacterized protein J4E90_007961 [Alternaria incomplexa]KAI4909264.1 hypothetical protein J4E90_007961 [Alternaria incomplexa]